MSDDTKSGDRYVYKLPVAFVLVQDNGSVSCSSTHVTGKLAERIHSISRTIYKGGIKSVLTFIVAHLMNFQNYEVILITFSKTI